METNRSLRRKRSLSNDNQFKEEEEEEGSNDDTSNSHDSSNCEKFKQGKLSTEKSPLPRSKIQKKDKKTLRNKSEMKTRFKTRTEKKSISFIDENTTNSDNSDSNNLFNEIDWEENLEVDTSALVDEFAPRPNAEENGLEIKGDIIKEEFEIKTEAEASLENQSLKKELDIKPELESLEQEFRSGISIFVMDYKSSTWNEAKIAEVDWDEDEVLVQYGDCTRSEEWVAMSSQRLSRIAPDSIQEPTPPIILPQKTEIIIKPSQVVPEESQDLESNDSASIKRRIKHRNRRLGSKGVISRKGWKRNVARSRDGNTKLDLISSGKFKGKFQVGEKVLAKWSDHRMQKFPAVIKKMAGDGTYDVLFYDGFEKTISEDHLYKTTEEESAKYQKTNPSEADAFVDMDANSKEARRERKKKTFDDFVFAKDLQRKKRPDGLKDGVAFKEFSMKRHYFKNNAGEGIVKPGMKSKRGIRRRKYAFLEESKPEDMESILVNTDAIPSTSQQETENSTPSVKSSSASDDERWVDDIPPSAHPLNIISSIESGVSFKSVVIPDKLLPGGWVKHAINQNNQEWKAFLMSPEGFKINTEEELIDFFRKVIKTEPAKNIDFKISEQLIPELIEKQKDLVPGENYQNWILKKARGRKAGPLKTLLPVTAVNKIGRVKTLLPKYRPEHFIPSTPSSESEGEVWRCVKEGCDKKFRKESLLQMHIKHYHVEFKALVGSAPKVVDLALARSESVNSDFPVKRLLPKIPAANPSANYTDETSIKETEITSPPSQLPSTVNQGGTPRLDKSEPLLNKRLYQNIEEKKPTIKTILPCRQSSSLDSASKLNFDSDDVESDNEAKLYKPQQRFKKSKPNVMVPKEENMQRDVVYPSSPNYKFMKKKLPALDKLQVTTDSNDSFTEEEKTSPNTEVNDNGIVIERLRSEEVINCTCGYREEDGLMIQCDICMCWQHGLCNSIECDSDVPDQYVCYICRNPPKVRASKKYSYALHYLTQGKLPSFSFRSKNERVVKHRELVLKRCYDISEGLHEIRNVDRSLRAKINIAEQPDHPKLYLWAKSWHESLPHENINKHENEKENQEEKSLDQENKLNSRVPIPEAQIEPEECRLRLLDHVDDYLQQMDDRLTSLQTRIAALESQDPDLSSNVASDRLTKQTIQMLLRDLKTVQKVAAIS